MIDNMNKKIIISIVNFFLFSAIIFYFVYPIYFNKQIETENVSFIKKQISNIYSNNGNISILDIKEVKDMKFISFNIGDEIGLANFRKNDGKYVLETEIKEGENNVESFNAYDLEENKIFFVIVATEKNKDIFDVRINAGSDTYFKEIETSKNQLIIFEDVMEKSFKTNVEYNVKK